MNFYIVDSYMEDEFPLLQADSNTSYRGRWCDVDAINPDYGDAELCPVCSARVSGGIWKSPRRVKLSSLRFPDRLYYWICEPMMISERAKNIFEVEGIKGIKKYTPLEVVKVITRSKKPYEIPKYYCAEISYQRGVTVNNEKSVIFGQAHDHICPLCDPRGSTLDRIDKLVLNTENWGGEDVFRVYTALTVVSQKFYDVVTKYGLTHFGLTPVEEYTLNFH